MNGELATKQDLGALRADFEVHRAETKQDFEALRADFEAHRAATKQDLEQVVSQAVIMLRGEMTDLRKELRGEMADLRKELRGEMTDLRKELRGEMADLRKEMSTMKDEIIREFRSSGAEIANTMVEQLRAQVNVVDEKYQDLPPAHAKLREDFDAHAADTRIHARVPGPLPRRARRSRSS